MRERSERVPGRPAARLISKPFPKFPQSLAAASCPILRPLSSPSKCGLDTMLTFSPCGMRRGQGVSAMMRMSSMDFCRSATMTSSSGSITASLCSFPVALRWCSSARSFSLVQYSGVTSTRPSTCFPSPSPKSSAGPYSLVSSCALSSSTSLKYAYLKASFTEASAPAVSPTSLCTSARLYQICQVFHSCGIPLACASSSARRKSFTAPSFCPMAAYLRPRQKKGLGRPWKRSILPARALKVSRRMAAMVEWSRSSCTGSYSSGWLVRTIAFTSSKQHSNICFRMLVP
mmetsp:Transcript_2805/g.7150  ORF Transcript_2805/g.7150 Transcript_2805/m.7150 type:complete len:288 (+) Transcript_2805:961-1824(+)